MLNGPSSAGKSTLAKRLQTLIGEKRNEWYEVVSIDDLLSMSPQEPIYEDDVFEISGALCEKVLQALDVCPGVVIDHVITSERIFNQLRAMLCAHDVQMVRVTCPLDVLRKREMARKNRCIGSAEASYVYLFPKEGYAVTVDTHGMTAQECALRIYENLY